MSHIVGFRVIFMFLVKSYRIGIDYVQKNVKIKVLKGVGFLGLKAKNGLHSKDFGDC